MCYVRPKKVARGLSDPHTQQQQQASMRGLALLNQKAGEAANNESKGMVNPATQASVSSSLIDELLLDSFAFNMDPAWLLSSPDAAIADIQSAYDAQAFLNEAQSLFMFQPQLSIIPPALQFNANPAAMQAPTTTAAAPSMSIPVLSPPFQLPSSTIIPHQLAQPNLHKNEVLSPFRFKHAPFAAHDAPTQSAIPSKEFCGSFTPTSTPFQSPLQSKTFARPKSAASCNSSGSNPIMNMRKLAGNFAPSPQTDTSSSTNTSPSQSPQFHIGGPGGLLGIEPPRKRSAHEMESTASDPTTQPRTRAIGRYTKSAKLGYLESRCLNLEQENEKLHLRCAILENGSKCFSQREQELLNRIKSLETQLGESHRVMLQQLTSSSQQQ
ncbi:hypothetical protein HDU81_010467 [Chytriomyces hyalinus]|nr:hypothetical protein HDU81_010467 [Chytriomyces hyalinus]